MSIASESDSNLQFIVEDNSKAVFLYNGVPYRIKALEDGIRWRRVSNYGRKHVVSYNKMIRARVDRTRNDTFHIAYIKMKNNDPTTSEVSTLTFSSHKVPELAKAWSDFINRKIFGNEDGVPPQRKLLVLINPFSGKKEAKQVWEKVQTMLKLAKVDYDVIETTHQGHAEEYFQTVPLDLIKDGIISVSGDGMFSEIINGILKRKDWVEASKFPLGIIPCGSGNGLAKSLGIENPIYAAFTIIKGFTCKLDVFSVLSNNNRRFGFLSVSWGFISMVDFKSEVIRFAGHSRFSLWAMNELIKGKKFNGKIYYYYPKDEESNSISEKEKLNDQSQEIKSIDEGKEEESKLNTSEVNHVEFTEYAGDESVLKEEDSPKIVEQDDDLLDDNENHENRHTGIEFKLESGPKLHHIPFNKDNMDGWGGIFDEITIFLASNVTHISTTTYIAPEAKFNDGCIDLIILRKASRKELLSILLALEKGEHINHPLVEYKKVKSFVVESIGTDKDHLMFGVDGELTVSDYIQVEAHKEILNLFCPQSILMN